MRMADTMPWEVFERHWAALRSSARGPMASSGRQVAGLLMLKHMEALSDERLIQQSVESPYYQYLCGETHFQQESPVVPTSLTKWRQRLGEKGMEWLLTTAVESATETGVIDAKSLAHVSVDSTVTGITYDRCAPDG